MNPIFRIFYLFELVKIFAWGFAVGILRQEFHTSFDYFNFINQSYFGLVMVAVSSLGLYNYWRPIKYKKSSDLIIASFLAFCLFQMSCVVLGYFTNPPLDGAWARNFVEVIFIGWTLFKVKI